MTIHTIIDYYMYCILVLHIYKHMRTYAHIHRCTKTHTHTHTHTHIHTCTNTHAHTHTYIHTHTLTNTHTHIHTHTHCTLSYNDSVVYCNYVAKGNIGKLTCIHQCFTYQYFPLPYYSIGAYFYNFMLE